MDTTVSATFYKAWCFSVYVRKFKSIFRESKLLIILLFIVLEPAPGELLNKNFEKNTLYLHTPSESLFLFVLHIGAYLKTSLCLSSYIPKQNNISKLYLFRNAYGYLSCLGSETFQTNNRCMQK